MKLEDKVVVITGSASGIGEACAHRFASEGAKVVVTDRNTEGVERVAAAIGSVGHVADVTVEDDVRAVADLARRTYGPIDLWFSNAGYDGPRRPAHLHDNADWELMWHVHVMAHVYAARAVLPEMLARGDGYLLQTASANALAPDAMNGAYAVTKHAALALAEWLAVTYRPKGVKVSCFCPGPMKTPMLLAHEELTPDSPLMQLAMEPAEVAELLVGAIDAEQFLVLDPFTASLNLLTGKATDYDGWITELSAMFA